MDKIKALKTAFGRFATGIGVVACVGENDRTVAITVNSFSSVSLDPPLVLWCIERRARSFASFMSASSYAVSILSADQRAVSDRFASHDPGPFEPGEFETWDTGAPLLTERLAGFDCSVVARHDAGDHVILVGQVLKFDARSGAPLIYFASDYCEGPAASVPQKVGVDTANVKKASS